MSSNGFGALPELADIRSMHAHHYGRAAERRDHPAPNTFSLLLTER
jgi:hypothetical protein